MSNNSYFPSTEAGQIIWLTHYSSRLPINGSLCGIDAEEIARTQTDILCYIFILGEWHPAAQVDAKETTAFKLHILTGSGSIPIDYLKPTTFPNPPPLPAPGIQKRLFLQVTRIKASLNYNEAIGKDLGIIAIPNTVEHLVPDYSLAVELGADTPIGRIDFKKYGHDGIWIECRINGGE